ncbi:glutathione S-transferase family protein [Roseospira marina]|uniref:Glutathione S-transferase family protein n=1 Tax=Roseospira marina TaxID=140057 RepID=A0A5M6IDX2_9PROT|nr:glutathione S-transferase family protein [Roseospira marina]KAA5606490.1 glutathione S-transferase family protein [Roseospira marina]MBB4314089.1 putative glutathione S-transferase [Roseospira marina]MBB5087250.1 putative glutathione S-transferase [Roseospira marina]
MGLLIEGHWHDQWYDTKSTGGRFQRQDSAFRAWVSADGSTPYPAEKGRYHLYVSLACPWAHRTLIARVLKGLEDVVSVSVVDPLMLEHGWELPEGADPILGARFLYQVYTAAQSDYTGRVTVPVLWDTKTGTIVSNESADILRMFNQGFGDLASGPDLYPARLHRSIDAVNAWVYDTLNNGVYKAGFATQQDAYTEAVVAVFDTLDRLEARLGDQRYLAGDQITEADWRAFTTLIRFDAVYHGHFKCNIRPLSDYDNLSGYVRELYQVPGVADTVNLDHIKRHYYGSHATINPTGIVPVGPALDFARPHGRDRLRVA